MAQVVIQRYVSVLFGGMAAPIMYLISFSFIAGLGAGSLISGNRASGVSAIKWAWCWVNLAACLFVALFIPVVTWIHGTVFPPLVSLGAFNRIEFYYLYVSVLQFLTSFLLAAVMGMNYPIAFESTMRGTDWERRNVAIFVLVVNTAGAAVGAVFAEWLSELTTLLIVAEVAAALYLGSAVFPLMIAGRAGLAGSIVPQGTSGSLSLELNQGCFFLFMAGLVGFSCESLFFRHYGVVHPKSPHVFGVVLGLYLVLWCAGVVLAAFRRLNSPRVFCVFFSSIAVAGIILLYSPGVAARLRLEISGPVILVSAFFFLPALFSGWYYSQIHNEVRDLDSRKIARLYFSNLAGSFVGGLVAGYVFPTVSFMVYVVVFLLGTMVLASAWYQRPGMTALMGAGLGAWALLIFTPPAAPHIRYYRSLTTEPNGALDVAEDWTTSCWISGDTFYVGGLAQTPHIQDTYAGLRLYQVGIAGSLRENKRICYIGVALGISNGRLGRLLPDSRIDSFDYSPAVVQFVEKYSNNNDGLIHQPNSTVSVSDGRLALMLSQERFDIVMEFGSGDASRGSSAIKSVEFLQLAKSRLRPEGVYVAICSSRLSVAAAQKVFAHVYALPGLPIVVATDGDLAKMIDPARLEAMRLQDAELQQVLAAKSKKCVLAKIKPLSGRYVRDIDPCADYPARWSPLTDSDLDPDQQFSLPF